MLAGRGIQRLRFVATIAKLRCMPPPSSENRPSQALLAFITLIERDRNLQSTIKVAENPQQIIDIAESTGCPISHLELRTYSSELSAHYFPWAAKGNEFRRTFFKRKG